MIGAGNVASALAPALDSLATAEVVEVWSRTPDNARRLADRLNHAAAIADLAEITPEADLYLISVTDDAISDVVARLHCSPHAAAAHTSGGVDASVLASLTPHYGVFYPLQTFTKGKAVDLHAVPLFVEASDETTLTLLDSLAESISDHTDHADSRRRAVMHAAAVFACNFANHCFARADDILRAEGLTLDVLRPLIDETVRKISVMSPADAQTGPARRHDTECIAHHESLLDPEQRRLYTTLSDAIIGYYTPNKDKSNT